MRSNEKSISEVKKEFDLIYEAVAYSLKYGKASGGLEHDTVVDLALSLGQAHTVADFAARAGGPKSHASLTVLVALWTAKYYTLIAEK